MFQTHSAPKSHLRNISEIVTPRRPLHDDSGRYNGHNVSAIRSGTKRNSDALKDSGTDSLKKENLPVTKRRALHQKSPVTSIQLEKVASESVPSSPKALSSDTKLLQALFATTIPVAVNGQATAAATTTTAESLNQVIGFNSAVFGQALKESTECVAFLKVAFDDALTEAQKTLKNKALIGGAAAATFLTAWVAASGVVAGILGSQLSGSNSELLIKSIEGATKLWAAYKLHQLIQLGADLKELPDTQDPGNEASITSPERVEEYSDLGMQSSSSNVTAPYRRRHAVPKDERPSDSNATNNRESIGESGGTALEQKYKARLESESSRLYGNLSNIIQYVCVQTAREGGELGVLSGVTLTPYLAAGTNIGVGVGTIALSGISGIAAPIAGYHTLKGTVTLIAELEKKFAHTDWVAKKCDAFIDSSGDWIKNMLVMTLLATGAHEIEEMLGIDVKLWDLKTVSPLLSEKLAPLAIVAALVPYDADPTFWQAAVIFYAWTKNAIIPTAKFAYNKFTEIYQSCKSGTTQNVSPENNTSLSTHNNEAYATSQA
ncbi:hypothetical protein [Endozoicomonas ascidiicola]|uniref:hypothetical protein n=1 Tax=Endozoicomonas ascidiicola TaxID=1698521 RepID=UPI00082CA0F9|nr:hypothetical protein [Endozoicomonas ascidiicola]